MMQPTPAPSSAPNSPKSQPTQIEAEEQLKPPPQNMGSAPFGVLVGLFEKLSNERKHERKKKLIDAWFNHWRDEKGFDLYPVLRLILPQKDRERAVYGLKEKNLAKTYIKLIPLGMKDPDAIRLLNWKRPTEREKTSGDFPTVLYEVVSKRSSVIESSLSIDELNGLLDALAQNMGKQDAQSKILQKVYNRSTPTEQRWIVRIILKDMNISVKETTVFAVFHPDAQDLYNTCSDLKKVAWELWDQTFRLNAQDKTVQLFHAFTPMLCKRPTKKIEDTVKEMGGSEFFIEEKLDGERMQLHKRGNEYFYCSRKGKDYTYLYGKHIGTGSLTPFIDKAFDPRIEDIILDGEMLVWDPISERNLPFGTLKSAALDKSKKEHNPRPCFKVFDLLYLNGQSLLDRSTTFRKKNMRSCLKEITGRIEFAVEYKGKTAKDIRERMDEVMAERGEGLVIKHPLAKYVLNGRNMDWIKVKPEYMDNMGETVDVLVVGGNYGSGKRGGGVSTLICAVLDDRRPSEDDDEPKYSSFVRIGSGLSFADYVWVREKPWKTWDPKHPPEFLLTSKRSHEDKGDVYLEPADSFILKVKAAEIVPSDQYDMGFTMRFPRALSIRDDLSIADCVTATEILESIRSEKKRKMENDAGRVISVRISQKKRKTVAKKPVVLPEYQGPKLKGVAVTSHLFGGMKFVVMSDPKSRTGDQDKKDLMKLIHTNGGTCAQIATSQVNLFVVYGGKVTPYDLKLLINKGIYDVIKPEWVTDSVENQALAPFFKRYFFHAKTERVEADDFEDAGMDEVENEDKSSSPTPQANEESPVPSVKEEQEDAVKEDQPDDTDLADWFKVDDTKQEEDIQYESFTDADSDNADVADEDDDFDDWFNIKKSSTEPTSTEPGSSQASSVGVYSICRLDCVNVTMGETEDAMEYDQEKILKHLCFYLDSPENAQKNGFLIKSKKEAELNKSFAELSAKIIENGGKIVALSEPKLTHIIIDKRDDSRRLELMKRTSKPKRRHLVVSEFIQACLEEETLLDEEDFVP
ncbi:DNA ligase 4 [Termitomyces sp. J132]|nr:DNA ligase 4 [Termitomyces sp. J132]